jgi:hypothetical protein
VAEQGYQGIEEHRWRNNVGEILFQKKGGLYEEVFGSCGGIVGSFHVE